jgi:hypothetical protein
MWQEKLVIDYLLAMFCVSYYYDGGISYLHELSGLLRLRLQGKTK